MPELIDIARIAAPLLLIFSVVFLNRKVGFNYPLRGLSCIGIFALLWFALMVVDKLLGSAPTTPDPLDSIFDSAVPVLLGLVALIADVVVYLGFDKTRSSGDKAS